MNTLKILLLTTIVSFVCFSTSRAQEKSKMMIPTSSSEKAVQLYYQSLEAAENAEANKSLQLMNEALQEDPNLFMAHAQRAIFALYNGNRELFDKHAEKAIAAGNQLNEAEKLLKAALVRLQEDPKADLIDTGKKIVKLYPEDNNSYYILASFQTQKKDLKGVIKTYKKGIKSTGNPAPFYNILGYTHMSEGNMKEAEKAFDKYIELHPNHPNPYDSKGDYYMENKEYGMAYESYMKAHEINPDWSYEKAEKAKGMMNE